jgi:EmrB/QacA subfamily drug resistance transporter
VYDFGASFLDRELSMTHDAHVVAGRQAADATPTRRDWLLLALLCVAQFMLILDITVVNVALPSIGTDLQLSQQLLTWVVTAYSLTFGGLMLLGGRLADVVGRRTMFVAGLVLFVAASLASGLAPAGGALVASRVAQGVGAALLSPAALALVTTTFHGANRTKALSVWAAIGGMGAAAGVLVGGLLTSGPGWEWVFFVNVPVGAAVLFGVLAVIREQEGTGRRGSGRIDLPGAVLVTGATALLILGMTRAGTYGWGATGSWLPIILGLVGYALFVLAERSVREPLVRLDIFRDRPVVAGITCVALSSGLLIAGFFLGSIYLQRTAGLSALRTGLVFLPVAVAVIIGAAVATPLLSKLGYRIVSTAGMVVTAAGTAWLITLPEDGGVADLLPGLMVLSAGSGIAFVAATAIALSDVDHEEAGLTSGLVNTLHEIGGALGVALASALAGASLVAAGISDGFDDAFLGLTVIGLVGAVVVMLATPPGKLPPGVKPPMI